MIRLRQAVGAFILVSALCQSIPSHAATYYVATTGGNSNPGTSSLPWRTVAYAASKMVPGDTTYVKGGTYQEGLIRFGRSGTSSAPIKLLNAPNQFPIINFIDKTPSRQIRIQNYDGPQKAIAWITIEGFEIRNGYVGIKMYNGQNITIRRNWIHHHLTQGINGNATDSLIDRNKINHNGNFSACASTPSICNQHHGIYLHGTAIKVTNSLIYDNLAFGIQLNGTVRYDSTVHPAPAFALSHNWVIANNTFAYQANGPAIVLWGSEYDTARIENNIFYENFVRGDNSKTNGIAFTGTSPGVTIRNNLAFASGSGGTRFVGPGGSYSQAGNIVNTLQPNFINAPATLPSSPNFTITSGSSTLGAPTSLQVAN